MPTAVSRKVQLESRKVRRLIADYVRLSRAKRPSTARQESLQKQIKQALEYLDGHAIHAGDSKTAVEGLLGHAPGHAGPDSWLYPGGNANESYRIEFQSGAIIRKFFDIIYVS